MLLSTKVNDKLSIRDHVSIPHTFMYLQLEQEKAQKEKDSQLLDTELEKANDSLGRANKEKKAMEERLQELMNGLQSEEDKASRLNKAKVKLESQVMEMQDDLTKEQKARGELEKARRKLEGDLKVTWVLRIRGDFHDYYGCQCGEHGMSCAGM